jgi:hypothetical protein
MRLPRASFTSGDIQRDMQSDATRTHDEWMINEPADLPHCFFSGALCPFVPPFREMAGVPLALTNDATELIFSSRCCVRAL